MANVMLVILDIFFGLGSDVGLLAFKVEPTFLQVTLNFELE